MVQYRYKIILSNKMIYKEAELSPDNETVHIGTTLSCNVRLRKELFFEPFELTLTNNAGQWQITCSDNAYITVGDIRKLITKELEHGDKMSVKYQSSDNDILKLSFMIDFDYLQKDYDLIIYPGQNPTLNIGGAKNCSITLDSDLASNEYVELKQKGNEYEITNVKTDFGVYINGKKADVGNVIRSMDFLAIAEFSFYFKDNLIYTTETPSLIVNQLHSISSGYNSKVSRYPMFIRNTRLRTKINTEQIEILDPPQEPQKPKGNLLMQLFPALSMIFITVVIRGLISNTSNSSFIIFSVCSMGIGIITSAVTIVTDRRQYKKDVGNRIKEYQAYIAEKRKQIMKYREEEVKRLNDIYLDPATEVDHVKTFSGDLFDRSVQDEDFLSVRLGIGDRIAERKIAYKKQEKFATSDMLVPLPEQVSTEYRDIHSAPITVNLTKNNVVGVVGNNEAIYSIIKNIVTDISTRHYYKDVQLFFLIQPNDAEQYSWLRWLPHVYNEKLKIRNIVWDDDSKNIVFEYLYVELGNRSQTKNNVFPHIIVFVLNDWGIKSHPVSQYISHARENNSTFVFCDNYKENIPQNCDELIILSNEQSGELLSCENKDNKNHFEFSTIDDETISDIALKLSPIYCEEVSLENALTKNISLFELLNILTVDDLNLKERWARSEIYRSMAAPLGVKTKNEIVYLDLHEKFHGPHGLVAGTTGSGKSEILQSYILSMATLFHPYEAGFVIIDFKGGGMVNQFKNLPHLVGAITNIDGHEINRSLLSIKAELQKRQRLFAQYGVNNINNYIKLFKAGEIPVPMPHLILVVDEFAELKAEQPDFMKELISAARIGRSLGVHLILATQKPSGQVNEQIWSNSKFKLCLKVQTKEDSNEVLKSPLAAEIKEPGRTYLQVGNNEIFELFQSAYSGAPAHVDDSKSAQEFSLYQVFLGGKRKLIYQQKKSKAEEVVATQLEAIVDYVNIYCEANNIEKLPDICLPPLPKIISYPKENRNAGGSNMTVEIGIYDDPASQYQGKALLDIANQNTLIIGSAQYGKTNLLQTIIRELSNSCSPDDVNIYVLDFGSMVLKNYESLAHVGGVVSSYEDEKLKNLFKLIYSEIALRKEKLLSIGVSSFASYREAGYNDLSNIVLIIDNFTALKELYLQEDDMLMPICRDGLSVGISVVLSNSQLSGLGYRYMTNFAKRIALYCNDAGEYSGVIDRCRMVPANTAGRGLVEIDKEVYEFQSYLAFEGDKEIDRVNEMRQYIASVNNRYPGKRAKQIPEIPKVLEEEDFCARFKARRKGTYVVPVGLNYDSIDIVSVDLLRDTVISIAGREKSGKTNFLSIIFNQLRINMFELPVKSYLVDDVESGLKPFKSFGFVDEYSLDCNDALEYLDEIYLQVKDRYEKVSSDGLSAIETEPLLLTVVQNRDAINVLSKNAEALKKYKEITGQYRSMKVCFIFSDIEDAAVPYSGPEIMKNIKERGLYYFNNLKNIKVYDVSSGTLKHFKKEIDVGDAYYLAGNEVTKIKTVKEE